MPKLNFDLELTCNCGQSMAARGDEIVGNSNVISFQCDACGYKVFAYVKVQSAKKMVAGIV